MMKRVGVVLALTLLVVAAAAEARTYKIGMVSWIAWAPLNIADAKGFWKEQGIDVSVVIFPEPLQMDKLFQEKRVDFVTEMIGTGVGMAMAGFPVTVIAEIDWSHGGDKFIIKKGADASTIKGTPVGIYLNQPSVTFFLNQCLADIGLKVSEVKLVEMENYKLADKFIAGVLKGVVCFDPDALRAVQKGDGRVAATSATYHGSIPEGILAMKDVLQDIPKADLVKIFRGWIKAVAWSQDPANQKEYRNIINQHTFKGSPPYSEVEIADMLNAVRIHDATLLRERNIPGGGLETYLHQVKAFLKENNLLVKPFEPTELYDTAAILEALEQ